MSAVPQDPKLTLRFIKAIREGDVKVVQECIQQEVDLIQYDPTIPGDIVGSDLSTRPPTIGGTGSVIREILIHVQGRNPAEGNLNFIKILQVVFEAMYTKRIGNPFVVPDDPQHRRSSENLLQGCVIRPLGNVVFNNNLRDLSRIMLLFDVLIANGFDMNAFLKQIVEGNLNNKVFEMITFEIYLDNLAKGYIPGISLFSDKLGINFTWPSKWEPKMKDACGAFGKNLLEKLHYPEKFRNEAVNEVATGVPMLPQGILRIIVAYGDPSNVPLMPPPPSGGAKPHQ